MNDHEWAALREHDGYLAALEVDKADGVFRCRVVNARAVLTFEGKTQADLKAAFDSSVAALTQLHRKTDASLLLRGGVIDSICEVASRPARQFSGGRHHKWRPRVFADHPHASLEAEALRRASRLSRKINRRLPILVDASLPCLTKSYSVDFESPE